MMGSEQHIAAAMEVFLSARHKCQQDVEHEGRFAELKVNHGRNEFLSSTETVRRALARLENAANKYRDRSGVSASGLLKNAYCEVQEELLSSKGRMAVIEDSLKALTLAKQELEASQLKKEWIGTRRTEVEEKMPPIVTAKKGTKAITETSGIKEGSDLATQLMAEATKYEDVMGVVVSQKALAPKEDEDEPTCEFTFEFHNVIEGRPSVACVCVFHERGGIYEFVSSSPPGLRGVGNLLDTLNSEKNRPKFLVRLRREITKLLDASKTVV